MKEVDQGRKVKRRDEAPTRRRRKEDERAPLAERQEGCKHHSDNTSEHNGRDHQLPAADRHAEDDAAGEPGGDKRQ
jgi:hypothetical protein